MGKTMRKRGQATVFAIVGIVIIILVALFFFLRNEFGFFVSPTTFLSEKSQPIEDNLRGCVNEATRDALDIFSKQGGDFSPGNYRFYESRAVKYYCTNLPETEQCLNVMPSFGELISTLNNRIQTDVNNCVDKDLVKSGLGYDIKAGEITTTVSASGSGLVVRSDYDVNITKGENSYSVNDIAVNYDAPIEDLYAVAVDIVNSEAQVGFFEQLLYMVGKRGQYIINLDKPYPDKIYKITKKDSDFEFWFAVEGERNLYGYF